MAKRKTLSDLLDQLRQSPTGALSASDIMVLSDLSASELQNFQQAWNAFPVEQRRAVLQALSDYAEAQVQADFSAIFRLALSDSDAQVRQIALDGLWEDEEIDLVPALIHLLEADPSAEVRVAAASGLGRFALLGELGEVDEVTARRVRDALLAAVHSSDDAEVRRRALEAVACMEGEDVGDLIRQFYEEGDDRMLVSAVFSMGRSCDERWASVVQKELRNPRAEVRYEAARAAGELEIEDAVPRLLDMIGDPDPEVQQMAIEALGSIGGERAMQALLELIESSDESLRLAAYDALELIRFNQDPLSPELVTWLLSREDGDEDWDDDDLDLLEDDWEDED